MISQGVATAAGKKAAKKKAAKKHAASVARADADA